MVSRNGFRCTSSQLHVGCHNCAKLIPLRNDPALRQCCVICTTYYCNLYYPPCKTGHKLIELDQRKESCKIDPDVLRGNKF